MNKSKTIAREWLRMRMKNDQRWWRTAGMEVGPKFLLLFKMIKISQQLYFGSHKQAASSMCIPCNCSAPALNQFTRLVVLAIGK